MLLWLVLASIGDGHSARLVKDEAPTAIEEPVPNGFARIHLLADDPDVRLYRQQYKLDPHLPEALGKILLSDEQLCQAPCGVVVDIRPGNQLYLGGPGMPSTQKFNLVGRSGDVVMNVHGGSYGELIVGYAGSWGGFIGAAATLPILILGLVLRPSDNGYVRTAGNVLTVAGGVGTGVGVAFGLTGLYLVHDGATRYELLPSGTRPPTEPPSTLSL